MSQGTKINFQHNRNEGLTGKRTSTESKNLNPETLNTFRWIQLAVEATDSVFVLAIVTCLVC